MFVYVIPLLLCQENPLITVDSWAEFPLYIAVNMALTSAEISFDDRNVDSR